MSARKNAATSRWTRVALFALGLALLPFPAARVASDPAVADNLDGSSTVVWNFTTPADYTVAGARVGGNVTLDSQMTWWNSTTAADFAGPDNATNVDLVTWPGEVALASTAGPPTLLTLQPGASGEDAWLDRANTATNYGSDTTVLLDGRNPTNQHPILRFDLSALPPNVVIDSVTLSLDQIAGVGNPLQANLYMVSAAWDEAQVTWNSRLPAVNWAVAGGDYDAHLIASPTVDNTLGWKSWNVTALVDVWYRGLRPNYGMIIVPPNPGSTSSKTFYSSDFAVDPTLRPKLDIWYRALNATGTYVSRVGGPGTNASWSLVAWNATFRDLVSDEFAGTSLDAKWAWTNSPASYDVGTTTPGSLHAVSTTGVDLNGATFSGNVLAQGIVGDFTADLKLSANPTANGQKAGLLAWAGNRDWYSLSKTNAAGVVNWQVRATADAVTTTRANVNSGNPSPAWLRLQRSGNLFTASTSPDGVAWTVQDSYAPPFDYPLMIRLAFFLADGLSGTPLVVDVDHLRIGAPLSSQVVVQTRTGDVNPVDGTWAPWSAPHATPAGSPMSGFSRYVQWRATLSVPYPGVAPVVGDLNLSWTQFAPVGSVETSDLVPADLSRWGNLSVIDQWNGQTIAYEYSLDSGGNWTPVVPPMSLAAVSVATGRIRFRATLSTGDTLVTPVLSEIRLTYFHRLDHFGVAAPPAATAGVSFLVTLAALDVNNSTMVDWTGTVDLAARAPDGVTPAAGTVNPSQATITTGGTVNVAVTATTTETIRVLASNGTVLGLSGTIVVSPGGLDHLDISPGSLSTTPTATQTFNVQGYDAWNNPIPGLNYSWSVAGGVGTLDTAFGPSVLFTAGTTPAVGFLNVSSGASNASAPIQVTVGPLASLVLAPPSASLPVTATAVFTAQGYDAWTNPVPGLAYSWNDSGAPGSLNASVGASVLFTSGTVAGSGSLSVTAGALNATGTVDVLPGPLVLLDVTPASVALTPTASQVFNVQGYDAYANPIPGLSYAWSVPPALGTLNTTSGASVQFTAGTAPATGSVDVSSGNVSAAAAVAVDPGALASLVLSPPSAATAVLGGIGFSAQGFDAWGNPLAGLTYTWSVAGGIGTLNVTLGPAVTLTAGTVAASGSVTVDAGLLQTTAAVLVQPGPLVRIDVSPPTAMSLPFDVQNFTAQGYDAYDNSIPGLSFSWSVLGGVGLLNATNGTTVQFVASPPPANGSVEATFAMITGSASVQVVPGVPPWVAITSPVAGAHVAAAVPILYTVSPDAVSVRFEYDGGAGWNLIGTATVLGGSYSWDTAGLNVVGGSLRAIVTNARTTANVTLVTPLEVDNTPPTFAWGSIADEQTTAGTLRLFYTTSADVVRVDFSYYDGTWRTIGSDTTVDGVFVWTPGTPINGVTLRAEAVDDVGLRGSAQTQGVGTYLPFPNPPAIAPIADLRVRTGSPYDLNLSFYLSDPDTSVSALSVLVSDPINVTAAAGPSPSLRFAYGAAGTYRVTLWVSDGGDTAWTILNVIVGNESPPVRAFALPSVRFDEDATAANALTNAVAAYFTDPEGGPLAFTVLDAQVLTARLNPDGTLDLWAPANWYGTERLRIRATDPSGGFTEQALFVEVQSVDDPPVLGTIAAITLEAGATYTLDLAALLSDLDTDPALLVVTTDSPYVTVNGQLLTLRFPDDTPEAQFVIFASDGTSTVSQPVRVTFLLPWWRSPFVMATPFLALATALAVVGVRVIDKRRWRPGKAFLVDEKGQPLRELTFDPECDVTFEQVTQAGALDAVDKQVRVDKYHAQTVRGEALAAVLVATGPVSNDQRDFAREMVGNVQLALDESVTARLAEARTREQELVAEGTRQEDARAALAAETSALEARETEVEKTEQRVRAELASIEPAVQRVIAKANDVAEREVRLAEATKALEEREVEARAQEALLQELQRGLEGLQSTLVERTSSLDAGEEELAGKLTDLEARETSLAGRMDFLLRQSESAAVKTAAWSESVRQAEDARAALEAERAELDRRHSTLEEDRRNLSERQARFEEDARLRDDDLAGRDRTMKERETQFDADREAHAQERVAWSARREEEVQSLEARQAELETRLGEVQEREGQARAAAEEAARREEELRLTRVRLDADAAKLSADRKVFETESADRTQALAKAQTELQTEARKLEEQADALRAEEARVEKARAEAAARQTERQAELVARERSLNEEADRLRSEHAQRAKELEESLRVAEEEHRQRLAQLSAREATLRASENQAREESAARAAELNRDRATLEAEHEDFAKVRARHEAEARRRDEDLVERDRALQARASDLEGKAKDVASRMQQLRKDEEHLAQQEAALSTREKAAANAEKEMSARAADHARAETAVRDQRQAVEQREREVAQEMTLVRREREAAEAAREEARELLAEAEPLRARAEEMQKVADERMQLLHRQAEAIRHERERVHERERQVEARAAALKDMPAPDLDERQRDLDKRIKIIQQKAMELLHREERLRQREQELEKATQ